MTIVAFLSLFYSLGLPRAALSYVTTYCATGKLDLLRGFVIRSLLWLLILNVLFGSVMLLAGPWIAFHVYHTPEIQTYLPLFALLMLAGVFSNFFGQALAAYKNVAGRTLVANFIRTSAKVILTVALVAAGFGLGGYIFAEMIGGSFLVLALVIRMAWRITPPAARPVFATFSRPTFPGLEKEVISFSGTSGGLGLLDDGIDTNVSGVQVETNRNPVALTLQNVATMITMVPLVQRSVNHNCIEQARTRPPSCPAG